MSDEDLIYRGRYGYKLTNLGSIRTSVLEGVIAVLADLEARPDFWLNHDISSIPPEMLDRLSMLLRSEMISPDPTTPWSAKSGWRLSSPPPVRSSPSSR